MHLIRDWMRPNWLLGIRPGTGTKIVPGFVRIETWGAWDEDEVRANILRCGGYDMSGQN